MSDNFTKIEAIPDVVLQSVEEFRTVMRIKERAKRGKIGRNEPCPCGSGKKYKKCCLNK